MNVVVSLYLFTSIFVWSTYHNNFNQFPYRKSSTYQGLGNVCNINKRYRLHVKLKKIQTIYLGHILITRGQKERVSFILERV